MVPRDRIRTRACRRGVTPAEVLIVIAILGVMAMFLLLALPRNRDAARAFGCRRNLMRIGQAITSYDDLVGHLPTMPAPGEKGETPLPRMLGQLGLGDIAELDDPKRKPGAAIGPPPERFIAGFICPADPNTRRGNFPAPISYRANAGATSDGVGGPFSPGSVVSLAGVQAEAGADYTASFSERLVGTGTGGTDPLADYRSVPGTVTAACPDSASDAWRGDAGQSWAEPGWRSTSYSHVMRPDEKGSCLASDGRSARIGASSGHVREIHVLMLGGSVRTVTPDIDFSVWRKLAPVANRDRQAGAATPAQ